MRGSYKVRVSSQCGLKPVLSSLFSSSSSPGGPLIRRLVALEHLLGILDILLPDALVHGLQRLGREPVQGHLVDPRLNLAQPLLLERDVVPHALRVPLDARLALVDPLDPLIGLRLLFFLLLLRLAAPQHLLRLIPRLRVLERHDAPAQVLALVVAAREEALDQVEVLDDLGVAAVLALVLVEEGLLVGVEAQLVQVAEAELERLLDAVQAPHRPVPRQDFDVAELLLRVPVAPVAVGGRGAELGGAFDLLLVDLAVVVSVLLLFFVRLLLGGCGSGRRGVLFLGGTAGLDRGRVGAGGGLGRWHLLLTLGRLHRGRLAPL
ncbi:hypothetical protein PG991_015269 [Apiospora marii]|uniref:Uncharacterized protein n=1 Tax=Apiospora marii TaxID=335849 RepID=A0ABR1R155_9PEZI